MSQFTTPLQVEVIGDCQFRTIASFIYYVGQEGSEEYIAVKSGFVTDFASVPRVFWSVLPPHGKYAKAAVLHDWLYTNAIESKRYADDVFNEAMGVLGVPSWKRWIMYRAVRLFGRGKYQLSKSKEVTQ